MDYAYGPSDQPDAGLAAFAEFYRIRANTTVIDVLSGAGRHSLEGLSRHLNDLPNAQKPIGDLFICSHGNESGWLEVRLLSILPVGPVQFDDPTDPFAGGGPGGLLQWAGRLALAPGTITAPGAGQAGTTVRFRACRIGHAEPFMRLLKHAYGGRARISAAKHFFNYGVGNINGQDIVYEYLSYSFVVKRRDTRGEIIGNRQSAVTAFRGAGFRYYDGSAIPNARWNEWIPRGAPRHKTQKRVRFRLSAGQPRIGFETEFRRERITTPDAIPFAGNRPTQAQARARARAHLATIDKYQPDYPPGRPATVPAYPVYARHGFADLDEFVDGFHWTPGTVQGVSALIGSRREYTLLVPIFDPATNLMLHNVLPTDGVGPPAPHTGLDETNAALFWNG